MKTKLVLIFAIGLLLSNCKSNAQKTDQNKSNVYMNKMDFEVLVKRFNNPEREKWQKPDLVIEKLGDLSKKSVGDLGAGAGYFSFRLAKKAKKVVALDVDKRFVEFIDTQKKEKQVDNLITRLVEYDNPKIADNELDILLIVDTYHHINNRLEYLKKCLQGISDGGTLCIVDFKKEETGYGPPIDHRLSPEEVQLEIEKSGFRNVLVDAKSLPYQYIITAKRKN